MKNSTPKVSVLAGATGLVGSFLLKRLLSAPSNQSVIALVRRPLEPDVGRSEKLFQFTVDFKILGKAESGEVDLNLPVSMHGKLDGSDLFCALGTTIKKAGSREDFRDVDYQAVMAFARWGFSRGAKRFFLVSAMGADVKAAFFYSRVKGETERSLGEVGFDEVHIFRPSLLTGPRTEIRIGEKLAEAAFSSLGFLFRGPLETYRPIEAEQVANAMVAVAQRKQGRNEPINIYESKEMASWQFEK